MEPYRKLHFIQRVTADYRIELFASLQGIADRNNTSLSVYYSRGRKGEQNQLTRDKASFLRKVKIRYVKLKSTFFYWQSLPFFSFRNGVVFHNEAKRSVSLYLLVILKPLLNYKLVLYGNNRGGSAFLTWILNRSDAYGAYTKFALNDINSNVYKSVWNNTHLSKTDWLESTDKVAHDKKRCLLVARIQTNKRIHEFFEVVDFVRSNSSDSLTVRIVGHADPKTQNFIKSKLVPGDAYIDSVKFGNRLIHYDWADFVLMPGGIGLHALDSLARKTPVFTYENESHGVEMAYLYEQSPLTIFNSLEELKFGCKEFVENSDYNDKVMNDIINNHSPVTIEDMAENIWKLIQGL